MRTLYGSVNSIDLLTGGLAEDHVIGGSVGPTLSRIIADQFERLRDGDRFWYQRVFSGSKLVLIEQTKLSDIIRRNTTITKLQDNVFSYDAAHTAMNVLGHGDLLLNIIQIFDQPLPEIRSIDGFGNNLTSPTWGMAGGDLLRIAPNGYADGISTPAGSARPSARLISNTLDAQTIDVPNDRKMSDWVYAWGQFIDHDLDLTDTGTTPFNIAIPANDPYFDPTNTGTQIMYFKRSNFDPATGI